MMKSAYHYSHSCDVMHRSDPPGMSLYVMLQFDLLRVLQVNPELGKLMHFLVYKLTTIFHMRRHASDTRSVLFVIFVSLFSTMITELF